jgi:transposase InsO family protein
VINKFLRRAQNEFDAKVKKIRSDNITEFKNTQVENFLDEEDIKHEFLAPYTPQQNGVSERKNRTLIEMASVTLCVSNPYDYVNHVFKRSQVLLNFKV